MLGGGGLNNVMLNRCVKDYFIVNENNILLNERVEKLFYINKNNTMLNGYIMVNKKNT